MGLINGNNLADRMWGAMCSLCVLPNNKVLTQSLKWDQRVSDHSSVEPLLVKAKLSWAKPTPAQQRPAKQRHKPHKQKEQNPRRIATQGEGKPREAEQEKKSNGKQRQTKLGAAELPNARESEDKQSTTKQREAGLRRAKISKAKQKQTKQCKALRSTSTECLN